MILITGGAGYIGSHCALKLLENNQDIIIFDNLSTGHKEIIDILKTIKPFEFIKGDLTNFDEINNVFKKYKIDYVIHFAGLSEVEDSVNNPEKYYYNNVFASMNLFSSMIENNVKKIVFSSSAAVYGKPEYLPIDELHSIKPINPYGETKAIIEKILADNSSAYDLNFVILRYFNVVGADNKIRIGEWHEKETHLIPNIIKSFGVDEFKLYGNSYNTKDGTCVRDYVDVEDIVSAHILAIDYLKNNSKSEIFNLGTNEGNSIKEILFECEKVLNKKINYKIYPKRLGDVEKLVANNQKAKEFLNWNIKNTLNKSIKCAFDWNEKLDKEIKSN